MIFVGYQGIGKSSIAGLDRYIDLESSNFWVDGGRDENWYKIYTSIANHLSKQGYNVLTSSHKVIRDYMKEQNIPFVAVYPSLELKQEWIKRLDKRCKETGLNKDYKALKNAETMYEENITDLSQEPNTLEITSTAYNLKTLLDTYMEEHK